MTNNHKISLSICHGFQVTYFMSQRFSIALIIEFMKIDNREVKENISFGSNASKFGMLLSTNILLALLRGETCRILRYSLLYETRILEKEDLVYHLCTTVMKNSDYSIRSSIYINYKSTIKL